MQRRPGDFSNSTTGKRRLIHPGWRRFNLNDSTVTHEDPSNHVTGWTETAGSSVVHGYTTVTLTNGCAAKHPGQVGVWIIPLTNKWGEPVLITDAFCLMTMCEFVGVTEEYGNANEHQPMFGLGISQLGADVDSTGGGNRALGSGLMVDAGPNLETVRFRDATSSNTTNNGKKLLMTDFHIGPGVGSDNEQDTNWCTWNSYDLSGDNYDRHTSNEAVVRSQELDGNTFNETGQAYLFAFCGSKTAETAGGTPATVSFRLWYMCHSDPSGWARFTT